MRHLTLLALIMFIGSTCAPIAKGQDPTKNKGGGITGRVTAANKAASGVVVTVSMSGDAFSGIGLTLKGVTDDEGRFRISNLSAGTYYVWPFVPAFVVAEATGVYPQGKSVVVEDGETAEDINFNLDRGAVITGKVADSAGRPVIDERIRILPVDANLRRLVSSIYPSINDIRTDDRGIYRVFGLPAGKYKLAIGDKFGAFTSTRGRRFYPQTFYPDVTDEAKAKIIEVGDGGEATNVDVTVARSMTGFSASGRFIDAENDQPVANINFGLAIIVDGRPSGFMGSTGASASDGAFRIDNLPPGRYAVNILPGSGTGYYGESQPFDIGDSDVMDLEAKIHRGSMISGNVIVEGNQDPVVWAKLGRARLEVIMSTEGSNISIISYGDLNPDGSFQIGPFQAGTATIRVGSPNRNAAPEFATLSIDLNGVDKSRGLKFAAGENITGLRVVAGYGTGTIRGTVRVEGGTLPVDANTTATLSRSGSTVVIFYARVDARGRFVFDHVPSGNYDVAVFAYLDNKQVKGRQPVVASDGVVTDVSVTLNLAPGP
ncbi:MAG TPA: carboxypeptidase-like regulatory domain-containing protein [Pyrinomonadaceae bacterium]